MVARPNNPIEKVRELQRRLYIAAKRNEERRFHALYDAFWRSDVLLDACESALPWMRACRMRRPSVSRMREIRTSGLKGDLRKRSRRATAPEVYQ
jgi:hypothetical protein